MLNTKSKIIGCSLFLLVLVAIIDFNLTFEIATFAIYLLPIYTFSYQSIISLKSVLLFSILVAFVWGWFNYISQPYSSAEYFFYNWIARAVVFILSASILKRLVIEKEQRDLIASQKKTLEDTIIKLHSTNEELNKFIGMASHDIRNPVGNIISFSDLLLEHDVSEEEKIKMIEYINISAKKSLEILHGTLHISQIQSGTLQLTFAKDDYIQFIRDCIIHNNQKALKKKQNIRFTFSQDSMFVAFDRIRLSQVIDNLLTNAIKYSDFNNEIHVNVRLSEKIPGCLITEITDHGMGIDEVFKDKLFDPFITTTNKPTDNETKTGLGLAIAKKIIELHQGTIGFSSQKGIGSTFFFIIPIESIMASNN